MQCQGASTVGGMKKALTVKGHTCNRNVIGYYILLDTLLLLLLLLLCLWIKVLLLLLLLHTQVCNLLLLLLLHITITPCLLARAPETNWLPTSWCGLAPPSERQTHHEITQTTEHPITVAQHYNIHSRHTVAPKYNHTKGTIVTHVMQKTNNLFRTVGLYHFFLYNQKYRKR